MSSELYKSTNYIIKEPLILNANIIEYDISKANINALYCYDMISTEEYNSLYGLDKRSREIVIGRKIATRGTDDNPLSEQEVEYRIKLASTIKDGIMEAKRLLFETNGIQDSNVIRIANDAIYVNNMNPLQFTSFDINNNGRFMTFARKKQFNMVLNLERVSIFIFDNPLSDSIDVDIKGISDDKLYLNEPFIQFICEIMSSLQSSDKPSTLQLFNSFYEPYIKKELPIEYYREFNSMSSYRIITGNYLVEDASELDKDKISIEYNLMVLRKIYALVMNS